MLATVAAWFERVQARPNYRAIADFINPAYMALFAEHGPAAWKKASPTTYVTSNTVPTLILHGTKDTTVNREQSQELATLLQKNGVEHHLELIPNAPHSFVPGDGTLPQDYRIMILDFFNIHLKN